MANNLLSNSFQIKIKEDTRNQFETYWNSPELSDSLLTKFKSKDLAISELKDAFLTSGANPINIYLTQFIINASYISSLIDENEADELFVFWESSEFAGLFINSLVHGRDDVIETSKACLNLVENHIVSYYLLNGAMNVKGRFLIKPIPEIGDYESNLYMEGKGCLDYKSVSYTEKDYDFLEIEIIENIKFIPTKEIILNFDSHQLKLRPGSIKGQDCQDEFSQKISKALCTLSELCPELFSTFFNFTHTIIALDEPGMVSFSLQSLPGYSSINLFERDFVDCIDDLIHENGHHYLNYILNSKDLILEDPEKDYFSPWRMVKRPIRGIYHGVFTFYWALELFKQIINNSSNEKFFDQKEISKIRFRYIEEFHKLISCEKSLQQARSNELIEDEGWVLINQVLENVRSCEENVASHFDKCNAEETKEIKAMIESLKNS